VNRSAFFAALRVKNQQPWKLCTVKTYMASLLHGGGGINSSRRSAVFVENYVFFWAQEGLFSFLSDSIKVVRQQNSVSNGC
jgi:hypothetical protein